MATEGLRPCWQNCSGGDDEVREIDRLEDLLGPLDEQAVAIRRLITGFEACYHEADKEAEFIAAAIGAGQCPPRANERPAQRKKELENAHDILSTWCEGSVSRDRDRNVGGIPAGELLGFIGEPSPLKRWQVARIVDKISQALDPHHPYYYLALSTGDYGEPRTCAAEEHYRDDSAFLRRTRETIIHDTADGRRSQVSLAFAIDLLMPCSWDFVGYLATILKAIGGDLHPQRPLACCARNIHLSPLCDRLRTIANTLRSFGQNDAPPKDIDRRILASLGTPTPVKRWLAASLDKTIRLHLTQPFDMDLF